MNYTALPSVKGQVTIPSEIREKYGIGKDTPLVIEDKGDGVITIRVMRMVDATDIEYYEHGEEVGLNFKKGIDPRLLIKAIKDLDG
ncbi:AbrB/MazE/SpoVT family DNA-binding domain-containing protein [Candidatus Gracilibacteria bacterium]|nr:AbrB/MazE/SpoVT family DNA-binding domain-containing protein [Candidatus Gracilibacteria bacterium]